MISDIFDQLKYRFGPSARYERQLRRFDDPRFWTNQERRRGIRRKITLAWLTTRQRGEEARQDTRVLRPLLWSVVLGLVASLSILVLLNALAAWLSRYFHFGSLFTSVSTNAYGLMVTAAVGALAVFLALFFTTVGVIASTAYARVPGEIRQLFVKERTSTFYVYTVVVALVFGTALLRLPIISSYQFRGLSVAVFAMLTVISVLSLAILGRSLFNFFDPSTLASRLYPAIFAICSSGIGGAEAHPGRNRSAGRTPTGCSRTCTICTASDGCHHAGGSGCLRS